MTKGVPAPRPCPPYCPCLTGQVPATPQQMRGLSTRHRAEYCALLHAIRRCTIPTIDGYQNYGGRGIRVDLRYDTTPLTLGLARLLADMGAKSSPDLSLDRIDNDGNYEPGNLRWATRKVQQNNRRPSVQTPGFQAREFGRKAGINGCTLHYRYDKGFRGLALIRPVPGAQSPAVQPVTEDEIADFVARMDAATERRKAKLLAEGKPYRGRAERKRQSGCRQRRPKIPPDAR